MRLSKLLAVTATLSLVGAVGCTLDPVGEGDVTPPVIEDPDNPPPAGPTAELLFRDTVSPMLVGTCAGSACHNGDVAIETPLKFLGPDPGNPDYAILVAQENVTGNFNPALALLVDYHPDEARAFTPEQQDIVVAWLLEEALVRGIEADNGVGDDPPIGAPRTEREMMAFFSACMDLNVWNATNMDDLRNKQTNNNERCRQCHNRGAGGFWGSNDNAETFTMSRYEIYLKTLYTTAVNPATGEMSIMANDVKFELKSDPPHPSYNWNNTDRQRLADFAEQTLARVALSLDADPNNDVCNVQQGFPIE